MADRTDRALSQSDDPLAALAMADRLEERGESAREVLRWRLYGAWHTALIEAVKILYREFAIEILEPESLARLSPAARTLKFEMIVPGREADVSPQLRLTLQPKRAGYKLLGANRRVEKAIASGWLVRANLEEPRYLRNRARQLVDACLAKVVGG